MVSAKISKRWDFNALRDLVLCGVGRESFLQKLEFTCDEMHDKIQAALDSGTPNALYNIPFELLQSTSKQFRKSREE